MTISEWLGLATDRLAANGVDSPRLEARVLLQRALGLSHPEIITKSDSEIDPALADSLLARRLRHEPIAYIIGEREFYGRPFRVTPAVLIPRQDTEILVERVLTEVQQGTVLDIGTGSGAIAVSLALENPALRVTGSDLSPEALEVAQLNAQALGADVEWVLSDLFEAFAGRKFELIASNPPYIDRSEPLKDEVRHFEPEMALFADKQGLFFYEKLAIEAKTYLNKGGLIVLEVGYTQAEQVKSLLSAHGWAVQPSSFDLAGIERVVVARYP
ncbi:MAG: peptide chain release factor N(5)-glutamine methyltransferase [Armatimonadetes bacterium]|nr:peptide chain release factor N(5)-glutamine methyltransferase [Armatimonadota bacterium]